MAKKQKPRSPAEWLDAPEEHDFPAAIEYLSLLFPESDSASIVESLRSVPTIHRKAKDLLRASRLELLPVADPEVRKDLNRVASGGRFNPDGLTAAHRSLPFGTKVRVTDPKTGRSVVVTINDRGPFGKGRVIDLSLGAARALGMIERGVIYVRAEVL